MDGQVIAAALAATGVAAAIRIVGGNSAASIAGAATGGLVALGVALETGSATGWLAGAAAACTVAELARPLPSDPEATPAVAMVPATLAAVLDPAYAALVLFAGLRLWRAPQRKHAWSIAAPIAGAIACLVALIASRADGGAFGSLWRAWSATPHATSVSALASRFGDDLGPLLALAAVAGLALAVSARTYGLLAIALGAVIVSLRAGAVMPSALVVAAIAAGLAIGRLAAVVRHPTGQACVGGAIGFLLVFAPAWQLASR